MNSINILNLHPIADEDVIDKSMDEDFGGNGWIEVRLVQKLPVVGTERPMVGWMDSREEHEIGEVVSTTYAVESRRQSRQPIAHKGLTCNKEKDA